MKEYHHLTPALVEELKGIVGEKYVYTDKDKLIPYEKDEGVEREYFHLPEPSYCRKRRSRRRRS